MISSGRGVGIDSVTCTCHLQGKSVRLTVNSETTLGQFKTQLVHVVSKELSVQLPYQPSQSNLSHTNVNAAAAGSNSTESTVSHATTSGQSFILSLSSTFEPNQVIKSVNWTKLLSIELVKRQLKQLKSNELHLYIQICNSNSSSSGGSGSNNTTSTGSPSSPTSPSTSNLSHTNSTSNVLKKVHQINSKSGFINNNTNDSRSTFVPIAPIQYNTKDNYQPRPKPQLKKSKSDLLEHFRQHRQQYMNANSGGNGKTNAPPLPPRTHTLINTFNNNNNANTSTFKLNDYNNQQSTSTNTNNNTNNINNLNKNEYKATFNSTNSISSNISSNSSGSSNSSNGRETIVITPPLSPHQSIAPGTLGYQPVTSRPTSPTPPQITIVSNITQQSNNRNTLIPQIFSPGPAKLGYRPLSPTPPMDSNYGDKIDYLNTVMELKSGNYNSDSKLINDMIANNVQLTNNHGKNRDTRVRQRSRSFTFANRDSKGNAIIPGYEDNYDQSSSSNTGSASSLLDPNQLNNQNNNAASSSSASTTSTLNPILFMMNNLGMSTRSNSIGSGNYNPSGGVGGEFTPTFTSFKRQSLLEPIIHQGELNKKNSSFGWKKRWFILTSKKLIYGNTQGESLTREMVISDYILSDMGVQGKYYCFALNSNSNNTNHLFATENEEAKREWIAALHIASHSLNITLDLVGVEMVSIPIKGKQLEKEGEYYKQIPSDIKVNYISDDISLFRSKMYKMIKMLAKSLFTSDHILGADLVDNSKKQTPSIYQNGTHKHNSNNNNNVIDTNVNSIQNSNSNSKLKLLSVTVQSPHSSTPAAIKPIKQQEKYVKLAIFHNGLIIKFKAEVNQTFESILSLRPDLFENSPNRYGLVVLGSMEHVFNMSLQLNDLTHVRKCLRYRKLVKMVTVDTSLSSKLFIPNVMNEKEWVQFYGSVSSFQDEHMDSIKAHVIRAKKSLPTGVNNTKLVISVVGLNNIGALLKFHNVAPLQQAKIPLYVEIVVMYGPDNVLAKGRTSTQFAGDWNEKLYYNIKLVDIPKESIFLTSIYAKVSSSEFTLIGQFPLSIQTPDGKKLLYHDIELPLLPSSTLRPSTFIDSNQNSLNNQNTGSSVNLIGISIPAENQTTTLKIQINGVPSSHPIYFEDPEFSSIPNIISPSTPDQSEVKIIENILLKQSQFLKNSERQILWKYRFQCKTTYPDVLPSLLYGLPMHEYSYRYEVYELIKGWPLLNPIYGLELLSSDFIDSKIREKGVESINQWDDNSLYLYLPQIIQSLKYESNHYSPLTCLLVKRGLCNPFKIGFPMFWLCANEIQPEKDKIYFISIRYRLIMEALLYGLGLSTAQHSQLGQTILQQYLMIQILKQINLDIIKEPDKQQKILETRLATLPKQFTLPTHPLQEFNTFKVEECKVKDSQAAPLWLVFSSVCRGADDTKVIFKKDDVRPDELCLQLFSVMDNLLKDNGFNCHFTIFKCLSVGSGLGLIEVVPKSITLADFSRDQMKYGSIEEWLKSHNPTVSKYNEAVDVFLTSCAAYSVATHILGIYDRHSDNLMISESGHYFHIDFGFFLGKSTKFLIFERETAPSWWFSLSKDMTRIIGSAREAEFKDACCKIFNIFRQNSRQLLTLVSMVKSQFGTSGVDVLRDRLKLELTNEEATNHMMKMLREYKGNLRDNLNNAIHVMIHQ